MVAYVGPGGQWVDTPDQSQGAVTGAGNPSEIAYTRIAWDTVSGSGALNGQTIDSGQAWQTGGTGYLTTYIDPAGYITGPDNTYCHINAGAKIYRATQYFSGPNCTIAIGLDSALTDMVHQNFASGGQPSCSYWKTGVGTGQAPLWSRTIQTIPNINNGVPHECTLELIGNFAFAYVDGALCGISYHPDYSTVQGNWAFAQNHAAANDRIYGIEYRTAVAVTDAARGNPVAPAVITKFLNAAAINVGNPSDAGFSPSSGNYFHTTDVTNGHVFGSAGKTIVQARATVSGYDGEVRATPAIGVYAAITAGNDGVYRFSHNGTTKLSFPYNISRVDFPVPAKLPAYTVATLPNVATFAQCVIYVSDGTSNKRLAISDGTNWRWPDGAIVS